MLRYGIGLAIALATLTFLAVASGRMQPSGMRIITASIGSIRVVAEVPMSFRSNYLANTSVEGVGVVTISTDLNPASPSHAR